MPVDRTFRMSHTRPSTSAAAAAAATEARKNSAAAYAEHIHNLRQNQPAMRREWETKHASFRAIHHNAKPYARMMIPDGALSSSSRVTFPCFEIIDGHMIRFRERKSDGNPYNIPTHAQRKDDRSGGIIDFYEPLGKDEKRYKQFMNEVAKLCAWNVLGKRQAQWSLKNLPQGYTIWMHKDGVVHGDIRTDLYLYGGKDIYRSPQEFAPHAIWLMNPSVSCICKHCDKTRHQKEITRILYGNPDYDDQDHNEDGVQDDSDSEIEVVQILKPFQKGYKPFERKPRVPVSSIPAKDYTHLGE